MIEESITKLVEQENLSYEVAQQTMREIMSGNATNAQIAAFLTALRMKGETVEEIAAFAEIMREHCCRINPQVTGRLLDTCGTGGDKVKTFNVSTAAAFVIAGAGVAVAKHGNRSVTSRCGSADVLERLGLNLGNAPEAVKRDIEQVGIGFMFAPVFHHAMKNMLEYEIIPAYYSFNDQGVPVEWISHVKNTMVKIAPEFTTKRMIDDYCEKYYCKLFSRNQYLVANDFEKAKELAAWKQNMIEEWDNIEVINYSFERDGENVYRSGHDYKAEIALDVKKIPQENVGVEFIITRLGKSGEYEYVASEEFTLVSCKRVNLVPEKAGSFFYGIRIYPKHKDLPHKQDFYLLRWID